MIGDGLAAGLQSTSAPGYLGDKAAVASILRELSGGTLIQLAEAETPEALKFVTDNLQGDCESVADIFLGGLPDDYPPVESFNRPGGIDVFLKEQFPEITETEPLQVVAYAAALYLKEVLDYAKTVNPDAEQSEWQPEIDAILDRWVNTFIGIPHEG
jgi:hypothetical protein